MPEYKGIITDEQINKAKEYIDNNFGNEKPNISFHKEFKKGYLGLEYSFIFIGIEPDGYSHS